MSASYNLFILGTLRHSQMFVNIHKKKNDKKKTSFPKCKISNFIFSFWSIEQVHWVNYVYYISKIELTDRQNHH